jgi:hypothetical protein
MGITQHFHRATGASSTTTPQRTPASSLFWPLLISNFILSALSIANLGLISSMVAFLLDQKHNVHNYQIDWPGTSFDLNVEPAHLWTDQGHTSNGVAGYGFFLGLFGMIVAWRVRKSTVRHTVQRVSDIEANKAAATTQVCHSPPGAPASCCSLYSQRPGIRLHRDLSNHGPNHSRTHRCQHSRPKLRRVQMDARDMVQSRVGSPPCGPAHAR